MPTSSSSFSCLLWWKTSEFTVYILSADGNCFILHVSSAIVSLPLGLAGFSFCSLTGVLKSRLATDRWKQSMGQAPGGIPSGRDLWGEEVWMGSHCRVRRNHSAPISPWTPRVCIYKQSSHAHYDTATAVMSFNICYSFSPRNLVWRHATVCLAHSPRPKKVPFIIICPHGHAWAFNQKVALLRTHIPHTKITYAEDSPCWWDIPHHFIMKNL